MEQMTEPHRERIKAQAVPANVSAQPTPKHSEKKAGHNLSG